MSWKHWIAVVLVIGLGIVAQIPRHQEGAAGDATHEHAPAGAAAPAATSTSSPAEPAGPYRTIALEVTGMT